MTPSDPILPYFTLDGWDRDEQGRHLTFVREDRLAKITIQRTTFADRGPGYLAKYWTKDSPHGRAEFEADVAAADPDEIRRKVTRLATNAPGEP